MNIFFCSDPHFGHKNIVKGVSLWDETSRCRDFDTLEEMNTTLIQNINNVVKHDDILYCVGDWSFGGLQNVSKFRNQLNVRTIHLLLGNHDHHIEHGRTNEDGSSTKDLFSSVNHYLMKKINGQDMVLCHYAMRTWDRAHHGTWMLYGHSHGTLPWYDNYKTMDVGFDTHPEFRPYHFDEIAEIMKDRIALRVDHHDARTN